SNCARRLNRVSEVASKSVPVVYWPGSKPAGLPSEQNTRLLAEAKGVPRNNPAANQAGRRAFLRMQTSFVVFLGLTELRSRGPDRAPVASGRLDRAGRP